MHFIELQMVFWLINLFGFDLPLHVAKAVRRTAAFLGVGTPQLVAERFICPASVPQKKNDLGFYT